MWVQVLAGGIAGGAIAYTSVRWWWGDRITTAVRSHPIFVVIIGLVAGLCAGASAVIGQAASVPPMVFVPTGFALGFLALGALVRWAVADISTALQL
jgi:hypothetical protein